jgi:cell migration-inducing and hyaluronan-binding protein
MNAVYALPTTAGSQDRPALIKPGTSPLVMKHGRAVAAWSDPLTWGGRPPQAGDLVVIPAGRRLLLDVDPPPLAGLQVDGLLLFDDQDRALASDWVLVLGELRVGDPAWPYTNRATLTLTGDRPSGAMGGMGTKFLAAAAGGQIALHGEWRDTRAKLAAAGEAGAGQILLARVVNWRPGDQVAIGHDRLGPIETRTLLAVDKNALTLDRPLAHRHPGMLTTVAGTTRDERSDVVLLTRNVVVQGTESREGFGGCLLVMPRTTVRLAGVELTRLGQPGRPPIHIHPGASADAVSLTACSFHHNFQPVRVPPPLRPSLLARNVVLGSP